MFRYSLLIAGLLLLGLSCTSSRTTAYQGRTVDNGYTQISARNSTGSVNQIENPNLTRTLADHLRSVAGVTVSGDDQNARVRIRGGVNSFNANTEPLFVVDGMSFQGFSQVYSAVNVADIKSITVLKDDSQTAIYGTRGMNGVIIIKTKVGG
jgi:TonB-dependent SusC/RagA subfamily outer membrane receptor